MDIQAAKKRCEAAGKEWYLGKVNDAEGEYLLLVVDGNGYARVTPHAPQPFLDFIVHARSDLFAALEALEEAQGKLEAVNKEAELRLGDCGDGTAANILAILGEIE